MERCGNQELDLQRQISDDSNQGHRALRRHLVRHAHRPGPRKRRPGLREHFQRQRVHHLPLGGRIHPRYDRLQRHGGARQVQRTVADVPGCRHRHRQRVPGASRRFRHFRFRGCECEGGEEPEVEQFRSHLDHRRHDSTEADRRRHQLRRRDANFAEPEQCYVGPHVRVRHAFLHGERGEQRHLHDGDGRDHQYQRHECDQAGRH